jgi:YidC/Oxa1 family membrane protein insertase
MSFLIDAFIQAILFLYSLTNSLGLAIIFFTIITKALLLPITLKTLRAQKKLTSLKPETDKLKNKYKNDKKAFQQAQLKLYQKHNINPLSGCLPQIAQLAILIILYRALINFLGQGEVQGVVVNPGFFWLDLSVPDKTLILPIITGISQLFLSLMIAPGGEIRDVVPNKSKSKKIQKENKKEEGMADMASSMQQQMLFIMPVMTGFFAAKFPAGLALYWLASTVFSIIQQYYVSGLGGIKTYYVRLKSKFL